MIFLLDQVFCRATNYDLFRPSPFCQKNHVSSLACPRLPPGQTCIPGGLHSRLFHCCKNGQATVLTDHHIHIWSEFFEPQMELAYRLDAISKGPKYSRFPGPNPLPPTCPRNGCCLHKKRNARGLISHRCINSYNCLEIWTVEESIFNVNRSVRPRYSKISNSIVTW